MGCTVKQLCVRITWPVDVWIAPGFVLKIERGHERRRAAHAPNWAQTGESGLYRISVVWPWAVRNHAHTAPGTTGMGPPVVFERQEGYTLGFTPSGLCLVPTEVLGDFAKT